MLTEWVKRLLARPPIRPMRPSAPGAAYDNSLLADRLSMRKKFAARAAQSRMAAVRLGITEYQWLDSGAVACDIAQRNDGKVFSYLSPPPEGHVGEGHCNADWCRCVAKSIVQATE